MLFQPSLFRTAKRCRISAIYVVRNTDVAAIEEVTAEADTTEEPDVKTVTMSSQTYQSGVTKTSETGSDSIKIPLFSLRVFIGDYDAIHYYTDLETYEMLLFVSQTEVLDLNYRGSLTYPSQMYTTLLYMDPLHVIAVDRGISMA